MQHNRTTFCFLLNEVITCLTSHNSHCKHLHRQPPSIRTINQNSRSGNKIGATSDHRNNAAVAQPVTIRTQTDGHPTSTNFPLSPTEVDHPVRSIAEYMLASEKIKWKKEYEYVTGLAFSFSSSLSALSNGNNGFPSLVKIQ